MKMSIIVTPFVYNHRHHGIGTPIPNWFGFLFIGLILLFGFWCFKYAEKH